MNNGGFASVAGISTVNFGNAGTAVTWGATGFFNAGEALILGSPNVAGTVDFQNGINLNGNRTVIGLNGRAAIDGIMSGQIRNQSGGGGTDRSLTKEGAGTLSLTGANDYSGGTTVAAGTLLANNATGSATGTGLVTVSPGATLGGAGFIAGNTTVAGTLSPGNSPGLLTFNDPGAGTTDLTLQSTANSIFEINGYSRGLLYDAVNVEGALTYGGTLTLDFANGFGMPTDTFHLFDFFGRQNGSFSGISFVDPGYTGTFDNASGVLTLATVPEPSTYMMVLGGAAALARFRRRRSA